MAGWDNAPAASFDDGGFQADNANATNDAWAPDATASGEDTGYIGQNVSKHDDGGCRKCGSQGHFARDCPEEQKEGGGGGLNSGLCYNCNEPGHNKSDCPNPAVEREFSGECRGCGKTGHRKADRPEKEPEVCRICKEPGHAVTECEQNRLFALNGVVGDMPADEAWEVLKAADQEKDTLEIKQALFVYAKAVGTTTLQDLEQTFRGNKFNSYLIAREQDIAVNWTLVNLQGKPDQKYTVSIQWSAQPKRAIFAQGWPSTPEENIDRLGEAGFPMDSFVVICRNCEEPGHTAARCEQEKREVEKPVEMCVNCDEPGHRARDCKEPPKKRGGGGCRNCGEEGHMSKECPEPRNMDNVECKNCNKMGHFGHDCPDRKPDVCRNCGEEGHRSKECEKERVITCRNCDQEGHISKECPEPRNMAKVQCRNCDEFGHTGRECPKPTDWSRVECSNCHEKGHTYKRCTRPAAEAEGGNGRW